MVLVALGLLVVSASFILYKYSCSPPASLRLSLISPDGKETSTQSDANDSNEGFEFHNDGNEDGSRSVPDDDAGSTESIPQTNGGSTPTLAVTKPPSKHKTVPSTAHAGGIFAKDSGKKTSQAEKLGISLPSMSNGKPKSPALPSFSMLPPPRPNVATPKRSTALRPPPSAASSLRVPAHRPPVPSPSSLAPTTSTVAPASRSSKKVLLKPGHSPLDWAHLTNFPPSPTFLRGADVPSNLIRVTPSLLKLHNGRRGKNAWGIYQGRVYNLTPYMDFHPGGADQLMRAAGKEKEGERLFMETHPWINWENMMGKCLVGILVGEEEGVEDKMDEMD
ncbi:MAG: hypothetical protein Q9217_005894 [Psora testacea]